MGRDWCEVVAGVARPFGDRSRFKLRAEVKAEPWGRAMIAPTGGYLEITGVGPYSVRELEWVEVEPGGDGPAALVAALAEAGVPASIARRAVRVAPDAEPGAAADTRPVSGPAGV